MSEIKILELNIDYTDTKQNGLSTMVMVKSTCPICEENWKRYEYQEGIFPGMALEICLECESPLS